MSVVLNEQDKINTLPTHEEFQEKVKQHRMSTLGNMFPILKAERARVLCSIGNYFIIGFVYAFLRLYKDKVIYNFLEASAVDWLKPINTGVSLILVGFIQSMMTKHGVNKGVLDSLLWMALFMIGVALLVAFKDIPFLQPNSLMGKEMFIGKTSELRSLGFFKCPALIVNNWIMSLFYVVSEVFGSTMVSYLYCTYMSYNTVGEQNGRFLKMIYIGANLALLTSGFAFQALTDYVLGKLSFQATQYAYAVVFGTSAVLFVVVWKIMKYNNELFSVPLFIQSEKTKSGTKKKVKTGLSDGLAMAIKSKLLMAMCAITLFYNFSSAVNSSLTKTTYRSVSTYYSQNPGLNKGGDVKTADQISSLYQGNENKAVSICVIIIMITPIFNTLFLKFGIGLFGAISILITACAGISCAYFSLANYGANNNGKVPFLGNWIQIENPTPDLYIEALAITVFNGLIKIGKYAFFDIIKESVSMKIDFSHRSVFKSVFDGVFGKLGKSTGSWYGVIMGAMTGISDARYYAAFTGLVEIFSCFGWAFAIYYLHFNYKKSVENDSYMNLGFSKGYNQEE